MPTTPSSRPGFVSAILHFQPGHSSEIRRELLQAMARSLHWSVELESAMNTNPLERDQRERVLIRQHLRAVRAGGTLRHVFVPIGSFDAAAQRLAVSGVAWLQRKGVPRAAAEAASHKLRQTTDQPDQMLGRADVRQTPYRQMLDHGTVPESDSAVRRRGLPIIT